VSDRYVAQGAISNDAAKRAAGLYKSITASRGRLSTAEMKAEFVERSRPKNSPTHDLFEWDDRKAAEAHRLHRAEEIIRAVYVILEGPEKLPPCRAFPVVVIDGKKGPYPIRSILQSANMTSALLEDAKADLVRWTSRYERLSKLAELREVFAVVEKVIVKKERKERKAG
jgi:hypothetical protein